MMLARALGLLGVLAGCALPCAGCPSTSSTRTTSAQKLAAGSRDSRTIDNAGYVDPGGRTGEVSTGRTATVGAARGDGVPPPRREQPTGSATPQGDSEAAPTGLVSASGDPTEFTARAARALCDRETYCGRIGVGKAFESDDACMVGKRERVGRAISDASCRELRGEAIAKCLSAIRGAACGAAAAPLQPPPACAAPALCR